MRKLLVAALLVVGAACQDRDAGAPAPEVVEQKREAARWACISKELARRAEDDLVTLEQSLGEDQGGDPLADLTRSAQRAALQFARAYHQHAQLRETAYAHADSAANHATRSADSLRHEEAIRQISIRAPEPGSLEANVMEAYQRNFSALRLDENYPCNWNLE